MEERRTNKHGLGRALSVWREKLYHFSGILWLSRACTRTKFPPTYQERWLVLSRWLTWLQQSSLQQPSLSGRRFSLAVANSSLLTPLRPCLSSSSSGLVGNLAHKPFAWVLHQNRQRNPLTVALPYPQNECPLSGHNHYINDVYS